MKIASARSTARTGPAVRIVDRVELESHLPEPLAGAGGVRIAIEQRIRHEQHSRDAGPQEPLDRRRAVIQVAAAVERGVADQKETHFLS